MYRAHSELQLRLMQEETRLRAEKDRVLELEGELHRWVSGTRWLQEEGIGVPGWHRTDAIRVHVLDLRKHIAELEGAVKKLRRTIQWLGETEEEW